MKRILLSGIPIIGLWLAALGWLGVREGWWLERIDGSSITDSAPRSRMSHLRVMLGDESVGTIRMARTAADDGSQVSDLRARLVVPLLGFDTPIDLDMTMIRPPFGDDGTTVSVRALAADQTVEVEGRLEGGVLRGTATAGGESVPLEIPIDQHLLMAGGLGPLTQIPPLGTGERVRITAVDPITLGTTPFRLRGLGFERLSVRGQAIETRVVAVEGRALRGRVWLDEDGELVRAETPLGVTLERIENDPMNEEPR